MYGGDAESGGEREYSEELLWSEDTTSRCVGGEHQEHDHHQGNREQREVDCSDHGGLEDLMKLASAVGSME